MATHSSILAWRSPWTEEPGGLQSIASQRVGHNSSNLAHTPRKGGALALPPPLSGQPGRPLCPQPAPCPRQAKRLSQPLPLTSFFVSVGAALQWV